MSQASLASPAFRKAYLALADDIALADGSIIKGHLVEIFDYDDFKPAENVAKPKWYLEMPVGLSGSLAPRQLVMVKGVRYYVNDVRYLEQFGRVRWLVTRHVLTERWRMTLNGVPVTLDGSPVYLGR